MLNVVLTIYHIVAKEGCMGTINLIYVPLYLCPKQFHTGSLRFFRGSQQSLTQASKSEAKLRNGAQKKLKAKKGRKRKKEKE